MNYVQTLLNEKIATKIFHFNYIFLCAIYDQELQAQRSSLECLFNTLKQRQQNINLMIQRFTETFVIRVNAVLAIAHNFHQSANVWNSKSSFNAN